MKGRTLMSMGAGAFRKKNIISVIVCLLIAAGMTIFLSGAVSLAAKWINSEIRIEHWQYVWVSKPEDFNAVSSWEQTDTGEIRNASQYKYLHLRTETEGGSTKILSIRSGNNLLNADVDGKRIYEQLDTGELFSGASNVEIVLEHSEQAHTVDIYMYVPTVLRFYATLRNSASVNLQDTAGILYGALLFGASMIPLLLKKDSAQIYNLRLTGVFFQILGICAVIGQSGVYIRQFSSPVFYKILIILLMTTAVGMQYLALQALEAQRRMGWILYVSALFPVSYLMSPYHAITLFILEMYGIWSAVYALIYAAVLTVGGVPTGIKNRAVAIAFLTEAAIRSLYWLSYFVPLKVFYMQPYLIAAGAGLAAAAVAWLNGAPDNRLTAVAAENTGDIYKSIENYLFEKADTNKGHFENVSSYVKIMCRKLKMPESTINMVSKAALLHDIGKIALPKSILEKEETVDKDEYEQLRSHVLYGYNILIDPKDAFLQTAANIAKFHHERYDGSGYLGMKGEDIDLYSRLTSIADTFDALTSSRAYKKAWSFDDAYAYINTHAGDYFDPELVKVFNSCRKEIWEVYLKNSQRELVRDGQP